MKKVIAIFCVVILLLAVGCNADGKAANEFPADDNTCCFTPEDRAQTNTSRSFVQIEDGCFYQSGEFIRFIPAGTDGSFPLCSKPNCLHNDKDCDAYCGWAFGYYDGALFAVSTSKDIESYELVKMNMDGTEHTVVLKLPLVSGVQFAFHHGLLFMTKIGNDEPLLENQIDSLILFSLDDYSRKEPFADYFADGNRMVVLQYFGEKLYGYSSNYKTGTEYSALMEWDTSTGTPRKIADGMIPGGYAMETTFYYFKADAGFREFDFETGETTECGLPVEDAWWATYDEDYIYLMGHGRNNDADHTLYFLTRDYEPVDQIELTDDLFYGYVSSDRVYFVDNADYEFTPITRYIEKADIGSGELTLQPFG